jgi:hypothetical protein
MVDVGWLIQQGNADSAAENRSCCRPFQHIAELLYITG